MAQGLYGLRPEARAFIRVPLTSSSFTVHM
jgi:hypothetical protein